MKKITILWFKNHTNNEDKIKLLFGLITNKVIKELGFNDCLEFIDYINQEYYLKNYKWFDMTKEGMWINYEDVQAEITSEYIPSLFVN
jgi:hypothetical protein